MWEENPIHLVSARATICQGGLRRRQGWVFCRDQPLLLSSSSSGHHPLVIIILISATILSRKSSSNENKILRLPMERGYCIPTVRTLHCCNVHILNSEWDCIPLYPLHQNEEGIGKSIPMGGCVTKRQRRVEYEVMYVKHQLVNLHLRWGTSRTKQKGLRSNWGACRFNTGPVCSCQSSSLCFLLIIKGHRPKRPCSGSLFF